MLRPPELFAGIQRPLASLLPARATVSSKDRVARDGRRMGGAIGIFTANDNQVPFTTLGQLAFNRRHPHATLRSILPNSMQQHAGVPDGLRVWVSSAPF